MTVGPIKFIIVNIPGKPDQSRLTAIIESYSAVEIGTVNKEINEGQVFYWINANQFPGNGFTAELEFLSLESVLNWAKNNVSL
jgi:hypothetical protein